MTDKEPSRIGFGLDDAGVFAVLFRGETAVCRLPSQTSPDVAMQWGLAWAEREQLPVDVVRVDVRMLR